MTRKRYNAGGYLVTDSSPQANHCISSPDLSHIAFNDLQCLGVSRIDEGVGRQYPWFHQQRRAEITLPVVQASYRHNQQFTIADRYFIYVSKLYRLNFLLLSAFEGI